MSMGTPSNRSGRRCVTHLVQETAHAPLCDVSMYGAGAGDPYGEDPATRVAAARVAEKWLGREEMRHLANAGYNAWLAMLPEDDWSAEYARAIPVKWDPVRKAWLDWDPVRKEWVGDVEGT